jgi:predicted MPP superfamily phosphohydrolase
MDFVWKIFVVLIVVQIFAFLIFWRRLRNRPRMRFLLIGLFLGFNLPWPIFFAAFRQPNPPSLWIISLILKFFSTWQIGFVLWLVFGSLFSLLVLVLFRIPSMVISRLKSRTNQDNPKSPSRRAFLVKAAKGTAWGTVLVGGSWGIARSELDPLVVKYNISPNRFAKSLDGLTIVHLSDLHIGLWTSPNLVPSVLGLARDLRPDLVVITGDMIDHKPSFSHALVRHLYLLDQVPLGVFAVIGNHDIYTGACQISKALETGGVTMLRGSYHSFQEQGLPMALVGVDDPGRIWTGSGGWLNLDQAMKGLDQDLFPVLLFHRPTGFEEACDVGIPLTLCGHTHGGQFALPGGPNLASLFYEYTHGLYKKQGNLLHVSAGIGTVGLPFRIDVPPEIVLLKLSEPKESHIRSG